MATYQGDATGVTPGIVGNTAVGSANGIRATSTSAASALYATATAVGAAALNAAASGPNGYAVYAVTTGTGGTGAYIDANDGTAIRARGGPIAVDAIGTTYGVYAQGVGGIAVWGIGYGGIKGQSSSTLSNAYGVLGEATGSAFAGWFTGRVNVTGQLTKGTGSFLIDHPLDPAGKLLEHSFVESPERKNVYDGVATADAAGEFRVQLPGYFEALNTDFRYQLTAIGGPAPGLHVKHEVVQGVFSVAGAAPGQRLLAGDGKQKGRARAGDASRRGAREAGRRARLLFASGSIRPAEGEGDRGQEVSGGGQPATTAAAALNCARGEGLVRRRSQSPSCGSDGDAEPSTRSFGVADFGIRRESSANRRGKEREHHGQIDEAEQKAAAIEAELGEPTLYTAADGATRAAEIKTRLEEARAVAAKLTARWEELEAKRGG